MARRTNPIRPGDLKETFDASGDACILEDTVWPDDIVPGFSGLVLGFMDLTKQLALRVLEALSYGMKLKVRIMGLVLYEECTVVYIKLYLISAFC